MHIFRKTIAGLGILLTLAGCAGNYQGLHQRCQECGFGEAKFSEFQACAHEKIQLGETQSNDYYNRSRVDLLAYIDHLATQVKKKKLSQSKAYENLQTELNQKILEEQQQGQTAAAIMAVALVGAAAVSCANTSSCGGGGYNSYYDGNCPCPYSIDAAGNQCGARSAYSRSGGASPICY